MQEWWSGGLFFSKSFRQEFRSTFETFTPNAAGWNKVKHNEIGGKCLLIATLHLPFWPLWVNSLPRDAAVRATSYFRFWAPSSIHFLFESFSFAEMSSRWVNFVLFWWWNTNEKKMAWKFSTLLGFNFEIFILHFCDFTFKFCFTVRTQREIKSISHCEMK